jgi:hypothetical protein
MAMVDMILERHLPKAEQNDISINLILVRIIQLLVELLRKGSNEPVRHDGT